MEIEYYEDWVDIVNLAYLLLKLRVPGAEQFYSQVNDELENEYCTDCEQLREDCTCGGRDYSMYDDGADYED